MIPHENAAEEISDLAKEMYDRMCSIFNYTGEEKDLMKKYRSLLPVGHQHYNRPVNIGFDCLKTNQKLIG